MGEIASIRRATTKKSADEHWLRRQAVIIAAQLPENDEDALRVLDHAKQLVRLFLAESTRV